MTACAELTSKIYITFLIMECISTQMFQGVGKGRLGKIRGKGFSLATDFNTF